MSLVLLDVDRFKDYNDAFGHPAGDAVLIQVARLLWDAVGDTRFVARYGGEEFAVILPGKGLNEAIEVAERLRQTLEAAAWHGRPVTASFGVCCLPDGGTPDRLLACADKGLYRAKAQGRNRVVFEAVLEEQRPG